MLCRVVARTNADLQRVLDAIVSTEGVVRSSTLISLATQVPYRILPLVRVAATSTRPVHYLSGSRRAGPFSPDRVGMNMPVTAVIAVACSGFESS
jgi:hypothetical protein